MKFKPKLHALLCGKRNDKTSRSPADETLMRMARELRKISREIVEDEAGINAYNALTEWISSIHQSMSRNSKKERTIFKGILRRLQRIRKDIDKKLIEMEGRIVDVRETAHKMEAVTEKIEKAIVADKLALEEKFKQHKDEMREMLEQQKAELSAIISQHKEAIEKSISQNKEDAEKRFAEISVLNSAEKKELESLKQRLNVMLMELRSRTMDFDAKDKRLDMMLKELEQTNKVIATMVSEIQADAVANSRARAQIKTIMELLMKVMEAKEGISKEILVPYIDAEIKKKLESELGVLADLINRIKMREDIISEIDIRIKKDATNPH
ncbi:MAG: hypothetical protein QW112_02870 [Candidatus Micrarchaeia archaeon]